MPAQEPGLHHVGDEEHGVFAEENAGYQDQVGPHEQCQRQTRQTLRI